MIHMVAGIYIYISYFEKMYLESKIYNIYKL